MRKLSFILATTLVALLVLASACGDGEEEGITVEDLTGIWEKMAASRYLQFNEDGTFRGASSVTNLENAPSPLGQFRLEGTLLTFITSDESPDCAGQSGSYQVQLTEEGELQFVLEEDPCPVRAGPTSGPPSAPWRRISP